MCTYVRACGFGHFIYVNTYICIYIYVPALVRTCVCIHVYVCVCAGCLRVCACARVCVCVYDYIQRISGSQCCHAMHIPLQLFFVS